MFDVCWLTLYQVREYPTMLKLNSSESGLAEVYEALYKIFSILWTLKIFLSPSLLLTHYLASKVSSDPSLRPISPGSRTPTPPSLLNNKPPHHHQPPHTNPSHPSLPPSSSYTASPAPSSHTPLRHSKVPPFSAPHTQPHTHNYEHRSLSWL